MWYLIVSIPDLCTITYFDLKIIPDHLILYADFSGNSSRKWINIVSRGGGGVSSEPHESPPYPPLSCIINKETSLNKYVDTISFFFMGLLDASHTHLGNLWNNLMRPMRNPVALPKWVAHVGPI